MDLFNHYDDLCACIRSIHGIHAVLHQLSFNEEDVYNNFFTILSEELNRDLDSLMDLKDELKAYLKK